MLGEIKQKGENMFGLSREEKKRRELSKKPTTRPSGYSSSPSYNNDDGFSTGFALGSILSNSSSCDSCSDSSGVCSDSGGSCSYD